ncbi:MAG: hypothetical protein ABH956_03125 [Candidatus Nealsonbacteria bacterium]
MKQERIIELLNEAADPTCSDKRLIEIQHELRANVNTNHRILGLILINSFHDCIIQSRDLLPSLFPVCAILCGDRDPDRIFANINWSLINDRVNDLNENDLLENPAEYPIQPV